MARPGFPVQHPGSLDGVYIGRCHVAPVLFQALSSPASTSASPMCGWRSDAAPDRLQIRRRRVPPAGGEICASQRRLPAASRQTRQHARLRSSGRFQVCARAHRAGESAARYDGLGATRTGVADPGKRRSPQTTDALPLQQHQLSAERGPHRHQHSKHARFRLHAFHELIQDHQHRSRRDISHFRQSLPTQRQGFVG